LLVDSVIRAAIFLLRYGHLLNDRYSIIAGL